MSDEEDDKELLEKKKKVLHLLGEPGWPILRDFVMNEVQKRLELMGSCVNMSIEEVRLVQGAGHALPLTHGEEVVRAVTDLSNR